MSARAWTLFAAVSVLWGIPYLFIKLAVEDLSPVMVAWGRIAVAFAILLPYAIHKGALRGLGTPLEAAAGLLDRGDRAAVAADRLRRAARHLRARRDPDRRRAARGRADGAAGRPRGARRGRAPRRPADRLRGRRRAARPRRRGPAGRAARRVRDPARRGRLRRRPDDHQAPARDDGPARAGDRLDGDLGADPAPAPAFASAPTEMPSGDTISRSWCSASPAARSPSCSSSR